MIGPAVSTQESIPERSRFVQVLHGLSTVHLGCARAKVHGAERDRIQIIGTFTEAIAVHIWIQVRAMPTVVSVS
jgi:hypothetical protein